MEATQLQAIAPAADLAESVTVTSRQIDKATGRKVENVVEHVIEPFTYRKLFTVLAHASKIFASLETLDGVNLDDAMSLVRIVMHAARFAGDDVQAIVALAIERPVEYFDTLLPDDGFALTLAVARVNKDFFVEKILPMMTSLTPEITNPVGETL